MNLNVNEVCTDMLASGKSYLDGLRLPKAFVGDALKLGEVDYRILGYRSPRQLAGLRYAVNPTGLLDRLLAKLPTPRGLDLLEKDYRLVDFEGRLTLRTPLILTPVTSKKAHINEHPFDAKDQGSRGTCVAFGSVAAFEHAYMRENMRVAGKPVQFSEQFQYWNIKEHDGYPGEGSWVRESAPLFVSHGCATEEDWNYNPEYSGDPGQGPCPAGVEAKALKYKAAKATEVASNDIDALKATLAAGNCVIFGVPVFDSWFRNPEVRLNGEVPMPLPNEGTVGGHAMCIVGYCDDETWPGGGYFIVRNSWSTDWAKENSYKSGHGFFPYEYMRQFNDDSWIVSF